MANLITRSNDDSDELYGWWDGEAIEAGDQVSCDTSEVAVFWDGEQVVTTLGPGRHQLTAESSPALAPFFEDDSPIHICFVTTSAVSGFEVEGSISPDDDDDDDDDAEEEPSASIEVTLRVVDPGLFVAKAVEIEEGDDDDDDDEPPTLTDFIAAAILDAACECLNDGDADDVEGNLPGKVGPALRELGVELVRVDGFELSDD